MSRSEMEVTIQGTRRESMYGAGGWPWWLIQQAVLHLRDWFTAVIYLTRVEAATAARGRAEDWLHASEVGAATGASCCGG